MPPPATKIGEVLESLPTAAYLARAATSRGALASPDAAAKVADALRAACLGDGDARLRATAALEDGDDDGFVDAAEAERAVYGAVAPVPLALADAHGLLVAAALARDHGSDAKVFDGGAKKRLRKASKDGLRHLDRNANDKLDLPAKARCVAAWVDPERVDEAPEPPPMLTPQWFAHRGSPDGRAYVSKDALAAATAEFFPEHKDLAKDMATSLLRHREQYWRDAEETTLSKYLTAVFVVFCALADYAIMVA